MKPVIEYYKYLPQMATDPFCAFLLAAKVDEEGYRDFVKDPLAVRVSVEQHLDRVVSDEVVQDITGVALEIVRRIASVDFRANKLAGNDMPEVFMNLKNLILSDPVLSQYLNDETHKDMVEHFDHVITMYCGENVA